MTRKNLCSILKESLIEGVKMTKVKKYTESITVRLNKITRASLQHQCAKLEMNEAVYGRKAIELCLKKNLINGHRE